MKLARIPATAGAVVMISVSLIAAPPSVRANDFAIPFGARFSAPLVGGLFVAAAAANWTGATSTHAWVSSLATHEDHSELGGSILCHTTAWDMHEGKGEWRHHDDDGGDDDHGGKSVPEPSTGFLLFSGVSALTGWRLRHRIQRATATVG
jgi:hypothetical protein